ncbi:hypothetical protein ES702_05527 [subsurface metagenome]
MVIKMALCKRCKKNEAIEGKKNCPACAEYMRNYMKEMRAKKKVLDSVKVPILKIHKDLANVPMILNENPEYDFDRQFEYDPEKKTLIDVNNKAVNNEKVNNVNTKNFFSEDLRYFYKILTGKVFRQNNAACIKELIKVLKSAL